MMESILFKALRVSETPTGGFTRNIESLNTGDLDEHGTLVKVAYSSLNYKDALSVSGNKGITRRYPHTPGIDASGTIIDCKSGTFKRGDKVIITGYDLGMNTQGGFGEYINVPEHWVVPLPAGLSLEESMILGTAGFTAALAFHHLINCGQTPAKGPVIVTGASGGVGCLSVALLSGAGFEVIASTGKVEQTDFLMSLGASKVINRTESDDQSGKFLLRPRWAGAIDTVGGNTLSTLLKACSEHGNVAACGNVSSPLLQTTVFPFILNGVNLLGVNSATTPMALRKELWQHLASDWKPSILEKITTLCNLEELNGWIDRILKGTISGRVVLKHQ